MATDYIKHLHTLNTLFTTHNHLKNLKMKRINIKGVALKLAATGGGAVAAASLNKVDFIAKMTPLERGAIKVALGAFGPQFLGKGKSAQLFNAIGDGMISVGAIELANASIFKTKPISVSGVIPFANNMYPVADAQGY